MLLAKKANKPDHYSQCLCYANWKKTGPGRSTILRGDWNIGLMDIITSSQLFTASELKTALGLGVGFGGNVNDAVAGHWYKFIRRGKIIFIPTAPLSNTGTIRWTDLYNAGLVYGVDGPGAAPFNLTTAGLTPPVTAPVNQKRVVVKDGHSFLVRTPTLSTLPTDQFMGANKDTFPGGEWWETMVMVTLNHIEADDVSKIPPLRWGDSAGAPANWWSCGATPHFRPNTFATCLSANNWSGYTPRDAKGTLASNWVNWVPVLEYIPE
jgi:hypothetical protein